VDPKPLGEHRAATFNAVICLQFYLFTRILREVNRVKQKVINLVKSKRFQAHVLCANVFFIRFIFANFKQNCQEVLEDPIRIALHRTRAAGTDLTAASITTAAERLWSKLVSCYFVTLGCSDVAESYLSSHESSRVTRPSNQSHLNFFRVRIESQKLRSHWFASLNHNCGGTS